MGLDYSLHPGAQCSDPALRFLGEVPGAASPLPPPLWFVPCSKKGENPEAPGCCGCRSDKQQLRAAGATAVCPACPGPAALPSGGLTRSFDLLEPPLSSSISLCVRGLIPERSPFSNHCAIISLPFPTTPLPRTLGRLGLSPVSYFQTSSLRGPGTWLCPSSGASIALFLQQSQLYLHAQGTESTAEEHWALRYATKGSPVWTRPAILGVIHSVLVHLMF